MFYWFPGVIIRPESFPAHQILRHTLFLTFGDDIVQVLVGGFVACVKRRSLNSTRFAMWFHRLFGSASCRFVEFFGGMLFENAKGAGTCSFKVDIIVRQEARDYLSVEAYNSA